MAKRLLNRLLAPLGVELKRIRTHRPVGQDLAYDLGRILHHPAQTVLDVGANIGQTAQQYRRLFPDAAIYSFEPIAATYQELEKNVAALPNVTPVRLALSDKSGTVDFFLYEQSTFNSTQESASLAAQAKETCPTARLDEWAREQQLDRISLLKIDVEGGEMTVLDGAEGSLRAGQVEAILLEISLYPDDQSHTFFETVRRYLAARSYYFVGFYETWNRIDNWQFSFSNALFVHRAAIRPTGRTAVMPVDAFGEVAPFSPQTETVRS